MLLLREIANKAMKKGGREGRRKKWKKRGRVGENESPASMNKFRISLTEKSRKKL